MRRGDHFQVTRCSVVGPECDVCGKDAPFSFRAAGQDVRYFCREHLMARIERLTVRPL